MEIVCNHCSRSGEPIINKSGPHHSAHCSFCGKWIKHIRQQPSDDFELFFGKYKGRTVKSMIPHKEEREYLVWLYDNAKTLKQTQKRILETLLHL